MPVNIGSIKDNKINIISTDLTLQENNCNFKCDYCLSQEIPQWKYNNNSQWEYKEGSEYKVQLDTACACYNTIVDSTILRVSGGEVLKIKGIIDFLKKEAINHEVVQIITNGFFLNSDNLKQLREIENIHIHMSLDGHSVQLNGCRVKKQSTQEYLLDKIKNAIEMGFPIEIGSVLTKINTAAYEEFLEFLLRYEGKLMVYPFPVRGEIRENFKPNDADIAKFAGILDRYERYSGILPPKGYLQEVVNNMQTDKRMLRCHIPKFSFQYFDDGSLTPCPNGWITKLGNVNEMNIENLLESFRKNKIYNLYQQKRPRLSFCRHCFTSLDILNLYLEDKITNQELLKCKIFSGNKTYERLKCLKEKIREEIINEI